MTAKARQKIIKWTVLALTLVAFGGSYRHGVMWVHLHTGRPPGMSLQDWTRRTPGFWEWVTAALAEVMVFVAVLSYAVRPRDPRVWATGVTAVAWTLWANGASAGHGVSGLVIAMWPAWAALTALTLVGHPGALDEPSVDLVHEPAEPAVDLVHEPWLDQVHEPDEPAVDLAREPDEPAVDLVHEPRSTPLGVNPDRVAWALDRNPTPMAPVIRDELGVSLSTAKRVRKAALEARSHDLDHLNGETVR
jgi:hypothetical protein